MHFRLMNLERADKSKADHEEPGSKGNLIFVLWFHDNRDPLVDGWFRHLKLYWPQEDELLAESRMQEYHDPDLLE